MSDLPATPEAGPPELSPSVVPGLLVILGVQTLVNGLFMLVAVGFRCDENCAPNVESALEGTSWHDVAHSWQWTLMGWSAAASVVLAAAGFWLLSVRRRDVDRRRLWLPALVLAVAFLASVVPYSVYNGYFSPWGLWWWSF